MKKGPSGTGRLVFILGHPLGHSLSPVMQNAAFRRAGLPWLYLPLDIPPEKLGKVLSSFHHLPVEGSNVTVPYKGAVLPFLDGVDPEARWLGSVNTIHWKGKKLWGSSTDGEGFLRSLGARRKGLRGSRGLLVGAGGAAKAVAGALASSGIRGITLANRSARRSENLARNLRRRYKRLETGALSLAEAEREVPRFDWIVQATSLGLKEGDPSPLSLAGARKAAWVCELIYHRETAFLRQARERRLTRLDGLGMLLHQGALSFELWTGKKAPLAVMRKALLDSSG